MSKLLILVFLVSIGCTSESQKAFQLSHFDSSKLEIEYHIPVPLQADKFNFPVGPPNAKGYYNAQKFGRNNHLGDDWNSNLGGNNDLGDPIYAVANGYINSAYDFAGGWGNVIRIIHYLPDGSAVESLYAHCDTVMVIPNTWVDIGDQIGTIGTAHGRYPAHLHLEIRSAINMPLGPGYSKDTEGYLDPTTFIKAHR